MKIALFGQGKTGSKVPEAAAGRHEILGPFHSSHLPSVTELRQADVAILFVPGGALPSLFPLLLEAGVPVVSGATGRAFLSEEIESIQARRIPWIQASNFSLGMNLALELTRRIGAFTPARAVGEPSITEVHHVKKLDAPSGTALSMKSAFGRELPIESVREGDVIGIHRFDLKLPGETLTLTHEATDRRVFAEGAIWAAELLRERSLSPGVHYFENVIRQYFFEGSPL